jgi:hypothetical protein
MGRITQFVEDKDKRVWVRIKPFTAHHLSYNSAAPPAATGVRFPRGRVAPAGRQQLWDKRLSSYHARADGVYAYSENIYITEPFFSSFFSSFNSSFSCSFSCSFFWSFFWSFLFFCSSFFFYCPVNTYRPAVARQQ